MGELANTFAYSCDELAAMKLPGLPSSRQGWDLLVKRDNWPFVEIKSKGRGGIRREYQPPADVLALIQRHKLAAEFSTYRVTLAVGEPLTTAENAFVDDYNADSNLIPRIDGLASITIEMLRAARRGDPLSVPEQPEFSGQRRNAEDINERDMKGEFELNLSALMKCREAVDAVLVAKGKSFSEQWRMAASFEAYSHLCTSVDYGNTEIAYDQIGDDEYHAAATLGVMALSVKPDSELFKLRIPKTGGYAIKWVHENQGVTTPLTRKNG